MGCLKLSKYRLERVEPSAKKSFAKIRVLGKGVERKKNWTSCYRYGFNGKETDNEVKGNGNQQDYGFRIYDPRVAKFLSVDPLRNDYPWYTPYQFAGNKPIWAVDLDGLEELYYGDLLETKEGRNALFVMQATDVGLEVMNTVRSTEGSEVQRDVYFITVPMKYVDGSKNSRTQGYTFQIDSRSVGSNGKVSFNNFSSNYSKFQPAEKLDLSLSKEEGNTIHIVVLNSNSTGFEKAKEGDYIQLSQTIYHEIKAHIEPKINPVYSEEGIPHELSAEQDHLNYHGSYSINSPSPENAVEGTPHHEYIKQATETQKNAKDNEWLEE